MKKRMLIATIVMLLVLAVALTTSSLAWFSSSHATVTASGGTIGAELSSAEVALSISKQPRTGFGDSLIFDPMTGLRPFCPTDELYNDFINASEITITPDELDELQLNSVLAKTNVPAGQESFVCASDKAITKSELKNHRLQSVFVRNDDNAFSVESMTLKINNVQIPNKTNTLVIMVAVYQMELVEVEGSEELTENYTFLDHFELIITTTPEKDTYTVHTFTTDDHRTLVSKLEGEEYQKQATIHINENTSEPVVVGELPNVNLQPHSEQAGIVSTLRFDFYAWFDGVELTTATSGAIAKADFIFEGKASVGA